MPQRQQNSNDIDAINVNNHGYWGWLGSALGVGTPGWSTRCVGFSIRFWVGSWLTDDSGDPKTHTNIIYYLWARTFCCSLLSKPCDLAMRNLWMDFSLPPIWVETGPSCGMSLFRGRLRKNALLEWKLRWVLHTRWLLLSTKAIFPIANASNTARTYVYGIHRGTYRISENR